MDTVRVRAHESSDFRLKSIENHPKALILQGFYGSGPRGRRFESCHSDQRNKGAEAPLFCCFEISYRTVGSEGDERLALRALPLPQNSPQARFRILSLRPKRKNRHMGGSSFLLVRGIFGLVVALQQCKFGFTARRSAGLHGRRRARESSPKANTLSPRPFLAVLAAIKPQGSDTLRLYYFHFQTTK